jgi:hypothetical protein
MSDMPDAIVALSLAFAVPALLCVLAWPIERWYMNRRTYNRWRK